MGKKRVSEKQTIPLKCFYWNESRKKGNISPIDTNTRQQMSPSSKFEHVEKEYDNMFILTKLTQTCYYSNTYVDFTNKDSQNDPYLTALPVFNPDKRYFTPGFILSQDKDYYEERSAKLDEENFQHKKSTYAAQANEKNDKEFKTRKPRSQYCYVCRKPYENTYFEHVSEDYHLHKLQNSLGEQFIRDTLKKYSQSRPRAGAKAKKKKKKVDQNQPRKFKLISKQIDQPKNTVLTRSRSNVQSVKSFQQSPRIRN